jgi:hypothetical protein
MTTPATDDQARSATELGTTDQPAEAMSGADRRQHSPSSHGWLITITQGDHAVSRTARYVDANGNSTPEQSEVIWPTWPATVEDETTAGLPLTDLRQYWTRSGNRLRDSAKWMAAVLGAAVASVIGTSPLASLNGHHLQWAAAGIALAGLVFLGMTMLLVLRVMRPEAVSYEEIENSEEPGDLASLVSWFLRRGFILKRPLYRWRCRVESHQDLYLPCGVTSLKGLRAAMGLEEATLVALAQEREKGVGGAAAKRLTRAQAARVARLLELRTAAAGIVSIGEYYVLRARSTEATYGGITFGLLGTAAIVVAFTWPLS